MEPEANTAEAYVSDTDIVCLRHVGRLKGSGRKVLSVTSPPDGSSCKVAVVVTTRSTIDSWSSSTDASWAKMRVGKPSEGICAAALSVEGHLTTASSDGSARVWGVESRSNRPIVLPGMNTNKYQGSCLALTHDGMIVFGGSDGVVTIRNAQGGLISTITSIGIGTPQKGGNSISSITCSPAIADPFFAAAYADGAVRLFSLSCVMWSHTLQRSTEHTSNITTVIVSPAPDGSLCATGAENGIASVWDVTKGKFLYEIDFQSPIADLCFSPIRYWLCAACEDGTVKIIDLETFVIFQQVSPPPAPSLSHNDDGDGDGDVTSNPSYRSKAYRSEGIRTAARVSYRSKACTSLCWSADGGTLYAGYANGDAHVFQVFNRD